MSWFDDRPWTVQYTERMAEVEPVPDHTTLELLADAVATAPQDPAITYLGGTLTYREVDELTDGVGVASRGRGRPLPASRGARSGRGRWSEPYRGETVAAFVSLRPGGSVEPEELVAYCREHLAAYKAPRTVSIRDELPKTTSGKILRRELRGATSS